MRTIKFVDYQDNEISSKEYADGTKASDVEVPKNSSNYHDKSTHTLFSWEKVNDVSADATYKEVKTTENHFWDAGKVTKNATTRNAGSKLFTCKVCGETKTETIPKLNAKSQTISTEFSSKTVGVSSVGKTTKINAKAKTKLTYKSSNTKFATVNSKGVVTYKGQGTATITITAASTPDYKGCKKTVKVTVKRYLFKYKALYDSNYRTGAGTNYRVVDSVKKGSTVYLLEKSEKKGTNGKTWAKIKVGNKYYWIQKNLLKRA